CVHGHLGKGPPDLKHPANLCIVFICRRNKAGTKTGTKFGDNPQKIKSFTQVTVDKAKLMGTKNTDSNHK
ncbi:hypothetical protein ACT3TP_18800, partial [Glutamicibacter sp. AOP38-B1-38]|uniref:hypothetical protein n=1 Tax=Glutamicibacter sp. AOP38-B1-38 TaxID=3457680 RepID=UPI0040345964